MQTQAPFLLICALCNQPVTIETANTDAQGRAVHTDGYAEKVPGHVQVSRYNPHWD